ncbi:MAG: peptidylprolyl isomerase [Gracilimonas sp.]
MRTTILFVLIFAFTISCSREPKPELNKFDQGATVAVVNADTIRSEFFTQAFLEHILQSGANDSRLNRYKFLTQLTDDVLLSQKVEEYGLDDTQYQDYKDQVKRISIADRFYSTTFLDTLSAPTEEQVESAFFNTKIRMYVSHLFFTEKGAAEKAYNRLEKGESFLDVANDIYNISPYDSSAGYIGEIRYFNVDHAFGEAAWSLKAGEYSNPVRTRMGYHIIYVNERVANPIMTQAEFDYKKEGITNRTKDRIMQLKGDAFVRTYMQSLDVIVNEQSARQLFSVLRQLQPVQSSGQTGISQQVEQYPTDAEVEFARNELEPNTILASYEHLGEQKYLTAEDYFSWFRTLPKKEARTETMASIGRALRNQVFYEAGVANGLEDDAYIDYNVDYKMKKYGAHRVKKYLAEQPVDSIPVAEQREAYETFRMNTLKSRSFTGWVIQSKNFEQAKSVKDEVVHGKPPADYEGFQRYVNDDVDMIGDLSHHIFRISLNSPEIVGTSDHFYVVNVEDRNTVENTFEDVQDELLSRMEKSYNIFKEIKELRAEADISVDTTAFENLMKHYDEPGLQPSKVRQ